jgi:hypothetical protein
MPCSVPGCATCSGDSRVFIPVLTLTTASLESDNAAIRNEVSRGGDHLLMREEGSIGNDGCRRSQHTIWSDVRLIV